MLNRRQLVLAGAGLLAGCGSRTIDATDIDAALDDSVLCALRDRVPEYSSFLTLAEVRVRQQRAVAERPGLIRAQRLGTSKRGQPIELLSLGNGRRSALLVAGLHPNEALGSLTVDFLSDLLLNDDRLRESLDYTWHFINPIDPDGMLLNETWFKVPLTPESYFAGFFRPPLDRQAEYTFPLAVGGLRFDASPPENAAWRRALELTKPHLQYTLHNAEYGGAFFLTSRSVSQLERRLQAIPAAFGLPLNTVGEPLSDLPSRAEGIFALPMPAELIGAAASKFKEADAAVLRAFWPAGDSSTSYANRFGTFSLSSEVPYWNDARTSDASVSDWTLPQIIDSYLTRCESGGQLLDRCGKELLKAKSADSELALSLLEHLSSWRTRMGRLRAGLDAGAFDPRRLSVAEAALYRTTMYLTIARPYTAIARLASDRDGTAVLSQSAGAEAQTSIAELLREIRTEADLKTVPLQSSVGVQACAAFVAARSLVGLQ